MSVAYMSSEESLSETAVSEWHGGNGNGIMVIEHTMRPASNQGARDDAPEFALAPTTYNRKRNLIISITQIIF